jgi:hypothetical protein
MDRSVTFTHPTPLILDNMLAVVAMRGTPVEINLGLRLSVWASLLHLRRAHGSLAAASIAASERQSRLLAIAQGKMS